jgi:hypothetical protein
MEPVAKEKFFKTFKASHSNFKVSDVGLYIDHSRSYLGATPDAKVSCSCCGTGVLEVKCPSSIANLISSPENISYLEHTDAGVKLKRNSKYYDQCLGQIALSNSKYCDFFVYTTAGFHHERIFPDENLWVELRKKLVYFFEQCVIPELMHGELKSRLACSMSSATPPTSSATPAPSTSTTPSLVVKNITKKVVSRGKRRKCTPVYLCPVCSIRCEEPDVEDAEPSIGCDMCQYWYHYKCVGITEDSDILRDSQWFCDGCNK